MYEYDKSSGRLSSIKPDSMYSMKYQKTSLHSRMRKRVENVSRMNAVIPSVDRDLEGRGLNTDARFLFADAHRSRYVSARRFLHVALIRSPDNLEGQGSATRLQRDTMVYKRLERLECR